MWKHLREEKQESSKNPSTPHEESGYQDALEVLPDSLRENEEKPQNGHKEMTSYDETNSNSEIVGTTNRRIQDEDHESKGISETVPYNRENQRDKESDFDENAPKIDDIAQSDTQNVDYDEHKKQSKSPQIDKKMEPTIYCEVPDDAEETMEDNERNSITSHQSSPKLESAENAHRTTEEESHATRQLEMKIKELEEIILQQDEIHKEEIDKLGHEHSNEIESILQQLDQLEGDFQSQLDQSEKQNQQKDIIIGALTTQCNDVQTILQEIQEEYTEMEKEMKLTKEEKGVLEETVHQLETNLQEQSQIFEEELDSLQRTQKVQIQTIETNVSQAAQEQLDAANQMYTQMQMDRDDVAAQLEHVETQLHTLQLDHMNEIKIVRKKERTVMSQCAQWKADAASLEAAVSSQNQQIISLNDQIEQQEREHMKLFTGDRQKLQEDYRNVCLERDTLSAENQDLSNVCEELMQIVEGEKENSHKN